MKLQNWKEVSNESQKIYSITRYIGGILIGASSTLTLALLLLSVFGGLTWLAELWAITRFIDEITVFAGWSDSFSRVAVHFLPLIATLVGAILFQQFASAIRPYLAAHLNEKASIVMNRQTFLKSMQLRLESFESNAFYNNLERTIRVQGQLVRVLEGIGAAIGAFMQLIVIFYAIYRLGVFYAIFFVLSCVPVVYFHIKSNKRFVQVNYEQSPTRRKQGYWRNLATNRQSAAEVRLFQLGPFIIDKWQQYTSTLITELWQARKSTALLKMKGESAYLILLFVMMGAAAFAGVQGTASLGAVVSTLYLLDRLQQVMGTATYRLSDLVRFYFEFQVVPEFLQIDEEEKKNGIPAPFPLKEGIRFDNVSFTYPGQSGPALEQLSFHIRPGERIALAGENGAGKSTLCLLLLGLYRPTQGRILIDGIDLADIDPASWRKTAAAVFQNYVRYQLTAEENIGFGEVERLTDAEKVEEAASQSGIHPVIDQFPNRYGTLLGKQYEESRDLSGGQWQKVAISRAYFRDAGLLILDEPAAALDAYSEFEVYKQFSEISEGKTVLIVSHRLGSARLADRIFFLKNGRLAESGSHDQLLNLNGEYAALFGIQSQWYQEENAKEGRTVVE
ncbi:ABC transporter ATP-binding protein [Paenibacillus alkalitolerans]|uniref:ABC transporter ATP-binding protein n=1 Tax=Paenibacillus alkalitolerans TaxID=2799335 RepID=UPI0018F319F2|nr:ABC transporter ATP-binding protein [Paenibacillus alkalitolerans]